MEDLIIAPILVIYYTWKCWTISGAMGPMMIYGYFIVGSILSRVLIKPIVNTVFYKELAEGNFRYVCVTTGIDHECDLTLLFLTQDSCTCDCASFQSPLHFQGVNVRNINKQTKNWILYWPINAKLLTRSCHCIVSYKGSCLWEQRIMIGILIVANESFSYFGSILSYLIVAMPIFAGAFAGKDPSEMSEIISKVIHTI